MHSNKKWGICCLVTPFAGLALVLAVWAIVSTVMSQMVMSNMSAYQTTSVGEVRLEQPDARVAAASMINVALGLVGIIFVLMIPVGLLVGIILLVKKDQASPPSVNSAQGSAPVLTEEPEKPPEPPAATDT